MAGPIIIVTRGSPLALQQTRDAAARLEAALGRPTEVRILTTTGDRQAAWSLEKQGGKGLFTAELEQALLRGEADLAIHSSKDLPTEMPAGLAIAACLPRQDARDVLVRRADVATPKLIATGSPRRRAQGALTFPQAQWTELRGNVDTRLKKLANGDADASYLAASGLNRLGITDSTAAQAWLTDHAWTDQQWFAHAQREALRQAARDWHAATGACFDTVPLTLAHKLLNPT
jgi:hydroxymethylbilane synthase